MRDGNTRGSRSDRLGGKNHQVIEGGSAGLLSRLHIVHEQRVHPRFAHPLERHITCVSRGSRQPRDISKIVASNVVM